MACIFLRFKQERLLAAKENKDEAMKSNLYRPTLYVEKMLKGRTLRYKGEVSANPDGSRSVV